jgi:hypothetical protein
MLRLPVLNVLLNTTQGFKPRFQIQQHQKKEDHFFSCRSENIPFKPLGGCSNLKSIL